MNVIVQQLVNGVSLGLVYALYALGFGLVLAQLRVFNIAHSGVFTWAAISLHYLVSTRGLDLVVAAPIVVIVGGILSVLVYLLLVRHVERRANADLFGFVSTLGGLIVLTELADERLGRLTVSLPPGVFPSKVWEVGIVRISSIQVAMAVAALASFGLLLYMLHGSRMGREIRAVAYDSSVSAILGVNPERLRIIVFFIAGAFAGIAAILFSLAFHTISANVAAAYVLPALSVIVIGGFGSVSGILVSGVLVGVVSSLTITYVSTSYRDAVVFAVMLLVLLLKPRGLFGTAEEAQRA